MPSRQQTLRLAKGIVLAQGNAFIKELLRQHGIRLGATKADFEANMVEAIEAGVLTHAHLEEWLRETEGWGDQHIYLYKIPAAEARALRQLADNDIKSRLRSSGLNVDKLWHADASLKFPNRAELTGIYRDDSGDLRFVWHRGEETWKREPSQDYQTELDGDLYQFKASRYLARRAVIRCEIRPAVGLVGLFLQVPTDVGHDEVLTEVQTRVRSIFDLSDRRRVSIAQVILGLDGQALTGRASRSITSRQMQLRAGGGSVTFASYDDRGYQRSEAVRRVRRAVRPSQFTGNRGDFVIPVRGGPADERAIRIDLYGEEWRARVRLQMTRDEVWDLVQYLAQLG